MTDIESLSIAVETDVWTYPHLREAVAMWRIKNPKTGQWGNWNVRRVSPGES